MSTEQGTVTKVSGDKAWVRVRRSAMCESCGSRSVCCSVMGGETMEAEAINTAGARVGDRVLLKIAPKSLWKISFIFYMLPVIFLIAGVIAGLELGETYLSNPELGALLTGLLACAAAFLIIKLFARQVREDKDYMPEINRIL